ncbi:MAG: proline--tRNA ligase, partial [Lachnospiraceae bacterium]|nr:proline--tRNA ligase [Lachnospiraceae bacterium]
SWGLSTRIIGALIMVHGDNSGLVLPPRIAPTQIMIVPIQQKKAGVLDKAFEIRDMLSNFRVKVDDSDKSPGFKFADQEMRGIPVRIEIGPRDIANGKCIVARRDNHEKIECDIATLPETMAELLPRIQKDMYDRAAKHLEEHTYTAATKEEFDRLFREKSGFVKAMWCGDQACEDMIKEDYGVTSRCMPFKQETVSDVCVCCGKPAKKMVYWGRAY